MEVEFKVGQLRPTPVNVFILLEEVSGERSFPIYIGDVEAMLLAEEIALKEKGIQRPRPGVYDLFLSMAEKAGAKIIKVVIAELKDHTFYANIHLEKDGQEIKVDARPSNAIPLAIAAGVKLFVEESVLKEVEKSSGPCSCPNKVNLDDEDDEPCSDLPPITK